jgi:hypothetical protein
MIYSERVKIEQREPWRFMLARRIAREEFNRKPGQLSLQEWQRVWKIVRRLDRWEQRECAR